MIEMLAGFPENVLAVACHGRVTREDYDGVLIPAVDAALASHARLRLYYEIARDFEGIDAGAVLEDVKVGVEHIARWERMAVVSDVEWIRNTIRAFGFLLPGRVGVFHLGEADRARAWIGAD